MLVLVENDPTDPGNSAQYCDPDCQVTDSYAADLKLIISYVGTKHPQVQVLLSAWQSRYAWWVGHLPVRQVCVPLCTLLLRLWQ